MNLLARIQDLGLILPPPPKPVAAYVPALQVGHLVHVSGQLPFSDGALLFSGAVPNVVSIEQAQIAARQCLLNGIAAAAQVAGGVEKIHRLVQITGYVQCAQGFSQQPQVINGASELANELMGNDGKHVRTAVGVSALPLDAPVEISFVFELN